MLISLDYDKTYTCDPQFWDLFVISALTHGHEIVCVTMRHDNDAERIEMPCPVVYTGRRAKRGFMEARGQIPDVWVDDSPHWIFTDG